MLSPAAGLAKPNQIVAVIQAPEIDRQYEAAVADAGYKKANARRAAELAKPGVVSVAAVIVVRRQRPLTDGPRGDAVAAAELGSTVP